MFEMIQYPTPQPILPLTVRRLVPDEAAQIAALYRAAGRDGAWCGEDTVRALFEQGAVWWGGFADGALALCAACVAAAADTPQAAALRGALAQETGCLPCPPEYFLLPPAISRQGEALAGELLPLLADGLFSPANGAVRPKENEAAQTLLAALPVKASAPVLAAYFAAGFAAVRMRPLVSLRPHYLFVRCDTVRQEAENTALQPQQEPDALRRVYLPLADTLAVSRLLEQNFCATALCRSSADERTLIRLERGRGLSP